MHHFFLRALIAFIWFHAPNFMVTTQSTNNDQIKTFICSPQSTYYPFVEAIFKNSPPNHIKTQKGKF